MVFQTGSSKKTKAEHLVLDHNLSSPHPYDPQVGSEGLIASLITQLCRERRDQFLNHPGPDSIRRKKLRAFFLITDFIGSGERVCDYLTAAWRVASVKSWSSFHLLRFEVIAYSATDKGSAPRQSPSKPP